MTSSGGTTAEGVPLGVMAGTVDLVQRVSTGIEVTGDVLRLNPQLPEELERLDLRIRYRGHSLDLRLTRDLLTCAAANRASRQLIWGSRTKFTNSRAARVYSSLRAPRELEQIRNTKSEARNNRKSQNSKCFKQL